MKQEKKLLLARNIFVFIVVIALTIIVLSEKGYELILPKVKKEMETYINEKHPNIENIKIGSIIYKDNSYKLKVTSNKNKNLYFYITRKNKKISDTYQKDYIEGNSLFNYLEKKLENEIEKVTETNIKTNIISSLDKYTSKVQDRIIKENNLLQLKFYTIEIELMINKWDASTILDQIINSISIYNSKNITPKSYTFIITNEEDITESIEIKNINKDSITKEIIQDILDDNYSKRLRDNKIKYNYLYKED